MTSEQKEIDYLKIFASVQQSILGQHIPTLTDKDTSGVKLSSLVVKSIEYEHHVVYESLLLENGTLSIRLSAVEENKITDTVASIMFTKNELEPDYKINPNATTICNLKNKIFTQDSKLRVLSDQLCLI